MSSKFFLKRGKFLLKRVSPLRFTDVFPHRRETFTPIFFMASCFLSEPTDLLDGFVSAFFLAGLGSYDEMRPSYDRSVFGLDRTCGTQ